MYVYYADAYAIDSNGNTVGKIGRVTYSIQGYSGQVKSMVDKETFIGALWLGCENWNALGGTFLVGEAFNKWEQTAMLFPAFYVLKVPAELYDRTYKIKIVWPPRAEGELSDYWISQNTMSSSNPYDRLDAYSGDGTFLYSLRAPATNHIEPDSTISSPTIFMVSPSSFNDTGFVEHPVMYNCYFILNSGFGYINRITTSTTEYENFYKFLNRQGLPPTPSTDDPYAPGGYSEEGGGGGEQNFDPDVITPTPLPTFSFADSGFCRIYKPTLTQLRALADYMWTDDDFLTTVLNHAKQLLEDPMESVISFSLVPVVPPTSAEEQVKVLFIPITGVSMAPVTNQFVEVDCGTLSLALEDNYGSALDFNPYTTIDLYLPFIGQVTLDTDEVMYKTIKCKYNVDVVTGMCVASISVMTDLGESVLYQFAGHCGVQMPLTSADFSGYVGAIIGATKMVAGLAAAGAGAPAIGAGIVGGPSPQTSTTTTHREPSVTTIGGSSSRATTRNPSTGRQVTASTVSREPQTITHEYGDRTSTYATSPPSFGELATKGAVNTVDAVMGGKMIIQHSGGFTGNSGFIAGVTYPYAIIKRPRQCWPANYAKYHGYPSMIYMNLGSVSGYTEVNEIHLEGMSATNPELGEIATLLKSGVIL